VRTNEEKCKIRSKGVMWGLCDPLSKVWDSLISWKRLKREILNLAERWTAMNTNE